MRDSRNPSVLTREKVKAVLANLTGDKWLMESLLYDFLNLKNRYTGLPSQVVGGGYNDQSNFCSVDAFGGQENK